MKTIPDLTSQEHLNKLISDLKKIFAGLEADSLLFYKINSCINNESGLFLSRKNLISSYEFLHLFEQLCSEGREWISLNGNGWFEGHLLIAVDYSSSTGSLATFILSGGYASKNSEPLLVTTLKII